MKNQSNILNKISKGFLLLNSKMINSLKYNFQIFKVIEARTYSSESFHLLAAENI